MNLGQIRRLRLGSAYFSSPGEFRAVSLETFAVGGLSGKGFEVLPYDAWLLPPYPACHDSC